MGSHFIDRHNLTPRNALKLKALALFAREHRWLTVKEYIWLIGMRPDRASRRAYTYLLHLRKWKLLRRTDAGGVIRYSITKKGRGRLYWLQARTKSS